MQPGLTNVGAGRTSFLFQINVTRRCQLRCSHCYILSDKKDTSPDMSAVSYTHLTLPTTPYV